MAALLLLPVAAQCASSISVSTDGQYQYNSNVFDVQEGRPVPGTSDLRHDDRYYRYGGEIDLREQWQQQRVHATLAASQYKYDHFRRLDHGEFKFDIGSDWRLGAFLDGGIEAIRSRTQVAFTEVFQAFAAIQTEQRANANLGFQLAPAWRLETNGYWRHVQEPLPQAPLLTLGESAGQAALKFNAGGALTFGVSASYLAGIFTHADAAVNPSYREQSAALLFSYDNRGRSNVTGQGGYSRRKSLDSRVSASSPTGRVDIVHRLTGKTNLHLAFSRSINSYLTNSSSQLSSDAALSLRWSATRKATVDVGYHLTANTLPDQGALPGTNRNDRVRGFNLRIDYDVRPWLMIRPYVSEQTRNSNLSLANFIGTVYGVEVRGTLRH